MQPIHRTVPISFLFLLVVVCSAQARYDVWSEVNGVAVRQGDHVRWNGGVASGETGWLVAWSDARHGELNVYSKYFDTNGELVGDEDGLPVSSGPYGQLDATIVPAQSGGWYLAFNDQRDDPEGLGLLVPYLQKMTPDGQPAWAGGPIRLDAIPNTYDEPILVPTSDGNLVTAHSNSFETTFFKVDGNGSSLWSETGVSYSIGMSRLQIVPDQIGGIFILGQRTIGNERTLVLLHIDQNGVLDENEIVLVPDWNEWQQKVKLTALPNGDVVAIWSTLPDPPESEAVLVGCRVDASLNSTFFGLEGGLLHVGMTPESLKLTPYMGDLVVAIFVEGMPAEDQLRGQRLHFTEEGVDLLWDDGDPGSGTILVTEEAIEDPVVRVTVVGENLAFSYIRPGLPGEKGIVTILTDGEAQSQWLEPSILPDAGDVSILRTVPSGDDITLLYSSDKPGNRLLKQVRIDLQSGEVTTPEQLQTVREGLARSTSSRRVVRSGDHVYVGWIDQRFGRVGEYPYLQRLDFETGQSLWTDEGINLGAAWLDAEFEEDSYTAFAPLELVPDGQGGVVVGWVEYDTELGLRGARLQRVDSEGNLLWGETGVSLLSDSDSYDISSRPIWFFSHDDGTVAVVFTAVDLDAGTFTERALIQYIGSDGSILTQEGQPIDPYPTAEGDRAVVGAVETNDNSLFLLVQGLGLMDSNLYSCRYDWQGQPLLASYTMIPQGLDFLRAFDLNPVGNDVQISWLNSSFDTPGVQYNRITPDGQLVWGEEGAVLMEGNNEIFGYDMAMSWDGFWVAWSTSEQTRYQKYSFEGAPQLEPELGIQIPVAENYFFEPELIADGGGGVFILGTSGTCCNELDFSYTHIGPDGSPVSELYAEQGILPLVDSWYAQRELAVVSDGEGGFLASWSDNRSAIAEDVYAMRVNDYLTASVAGDRPHAQPDQFVLEPAYPNPFNPSTTIRFTIPEAGEVRLAVYDILGRHIATLLSGRVESGSHEISWNGVGISGQQVASGVYFITLDNQGMSRARQIVLLK